MVSDPAWFPSAAMQTLGAMYAIFVAVYVLVLQKMVIQKEPTLHRLANFCFVLLSVIVGITILLNAAVLYSLCTPYLEWSDFLYDGGFYAFLSSIMYILGFTVLLSIRVAQR